MKSLLPFFLVLLLSCQQTTKPDPRQVMSLESIKQILVQHNQKIIAATKGQTFELMKELYESTSLLMPEYNPVIKSLVNINTYYDTLFARMPIKTYSRQTLEVTLIDDRVIEIGLFTKVLENGLSYKGKYLTVWRVDLLANLTIRAEAFGYLHQVENPSLLVVKAAHGITALAVEMPWEMEAYNALNETNVMDRIPEKSANAYTADAMYLPFADSIKSGKAALLDHYKGYYQYPAKIDSLQNVTYAYDQVDDGYIRYTGFYVDWTVPQFSGNTRGTGISYWKREQDNTLRIHRQIGLHIHQEQ